jgi:hypothetical protein
LIVAGSTRSVKKAWIWFLVASLAYLRRFSGDFGGQGKVLTSPDAMGECKTP